VAKQALSLNIPNSKNIRRLHKEYKEGELKKETTELGVKQSTNYTSLTLDIS
jgi:hypothetical protein